MKDYELFDNWVAAIKKSCARSSNWKIIGDWCYSTLANKHRGPQQMYHLCDGSHKLYLIDSHPERKEQVTRMHHKHCIACGDLVPEGLKMVVMLLESNI